MKRFLVKILAFAIIFALVDFAAGFALKAAYYKADKADCGRNNFMMRELKDKDILVFGSSRAVHHYSPKEIQSTLNSSCYNCGEDGMGVIMSYGRLNAILSRYTPKAIIYDIEPTYDIQVNDNSRYLGKLKPYYPQFEIPDIFNDVSSVEKYKMMSHFYRYNSQLVDILIGIFSSYPETADQFTYSPSYNTMRHEPMELLKLDTNLDSIKVNYLHKFVAACRDHGVKLFLAVSPKYKAEDVDFSTMLKDLTGDKEITVLDHYSDTTFVNHRELFADRAHLNKKGAEKYTSIISREIMALEDND